VIFRQLGCLGNAASFLAGPLAPEEIVSIFGQNLGRANSASRRPGPHHHYPFQLAGTLVSFGDDKVSSVGTPKFFESGPAKTESSARPILTLNPGLRKSMGASGRHWSKLRIG
jgi:hypothetical protein